MYGDDDVRRLHRVNLLRHVGIPLAQIPEALEGSPDQLADAVERHLAVLDERLSAMGRLRERIRAVGECLREQPEGPTSVSWSRSWKGWVRWTPTSRSD
ncbi:MAG TPA: MerR family DNA-binding protein [Lapillicoccus sp.]|nr:MerR family DNA-binding protein [Lapillicoccus sp.]